jgi:hypothetical protein
MEAVGGLWGDVGAQLKAMRLRLGYAKTWDLFEACGKPAHRTMDAIEAGRIGTLKTLDDYCEVLQSSTADVLRQVLAPRAPLDADAVRVGAAYQAQTVDPSVKALQQTLWEVALIVEARTQE